MRIGLFTDTYLPDINGVVSSIEALRCSLVDLGHEVFVICTKPSLKLSTMEGNVLRLPGVEVKKLYGYSLTGPVHLKALQTIKEMKLDVIHAHTEFGAGVFARMVSKYLSIPLVATYHTFYEDYTHYLNVFHSDTMERYLKKATIEFSKIFGNACQQLIVPTEKTKERLLQYGVVTKMTIIPTGLDLSIFETDEVIEDPFMDDSFKLLYVGRLAPEKSVEVIIDAVHLLREQNQNVSLLIVGDGPSYSDIEKLIGNLQANSYIKMAGRIKHDDVGKYYNLADCFISASMSETQGMTFIEAMACGKPVMAADRVALNNVLLDGVNGFYFEDSEDLSTTILLLMEKSEEEVNQMKMSAKEIAKQYSSPVFGKKVVEVYQDAIESYQQVAMISKIKLKDDEVKLTLTNPENDTTYTISIDDYLELRYRKGQGLDEFDISKLSQQHNYWYGYKHTLRKLAGSDKSEKEINQYLDSLRILNEEQKSQIIQQMKMRGYLSDESVAESQFYSDQIKLVGRKKTMSNLRKRGVSKKVIQEFNEVVDSEAEKQRAIKKAQLYLKTIHDKSYRETCYLVKQKLISDGFENTDEIISEIEYNFDEEKEREALVKAALKAQRSYGKKYQGSQLASQQYKYLVTKGYSPALIQEVLASLQEEENED